MIIYKLTNIINNKIYIGQTIHTLKQRFNEHCRSTTEYPINNALRKYGKNNFLVEIIYSSFDQIDLNEKEKYFINEFKARVPFGYNLTNGGKGSTGLKWTQKSRQKLSDTQKKVGRGFAGPHSEETKNKIRLKNLGRPNLKLRGIKWSEKINEQRRKTFLLQKRSQPLIAINRYTGIALYFDSIRNASQNLNIGQRSIYLDINNFNECKKYCFIKDN